MRARRVTRKPGEMVQRLASMKTWVVACALAPPAVAHVASAQVRSTSTAPAAALVLDRVTVIDVEHGGS